MNDAASAFSANDVEQENREIGGISDRFDTDIVGLYGVACLSQENDFHGKTDCVNIPNSSLDSMLYGRFDVCTNSMKI